jgi:hypothetical protein
MEIEFGEQNFHYFSAKSLTSCGFFRDNSKIWIKRAKQQILRYFKSTLLVQKTSQF